MRRWNGWGDEQVDYPLTASAQKYLQHVLGAGPVLPDISLEKALELVPPTGLVALKSDQRHDFNLTTDSDERLFHARGQSLPDWIAIRSGEIDTYPDGVAYPQTKDQVRALLDYANQAGVSLIPYGGGTSVVGHINPLAHQRPVITVNMSRINKLLDLDRTSQLARFGAGVRGPDLETQLRQHGFTLGHFPQSFELSTLGGWIATRSSGQQSDYYGRIEDIFAGGQLETPAGALQLPAFPASAAGPDLRQLILGSEGRFGIITDATVRIRPIPEFEAFFGAFFKHWEQGVAALRSCAQEGILASMLRLSDPVETDTTFRLAGKDQLVTCAKRGLNILGYGHERCLLIYGVTGKRRGAHHVLRRVNQIIRDYQGIPTGQAIGKLWVKSRFRSPYLRNTLWECGYALDTLETAVPWAKIDEMSEAIRQSLKTGLDSYGERLLVFLHLSHIYTEGASIYTTFLFRRDSSPGETLERWQKLKTAASQAIVAYGGTISHQHGVGLDHLPYISAEKGALGLAALSAAQSTFDPAGIMNPGKLFPEQEVNNVD